MTAPVRVVVGGKEYNQHQVKCPVCHELMTLRPGRVNPRPYYACPTAKACGTAHGAHPDGTPLGIPADRCVKEARMAAHAIFDRLWKGPAAPWTRPQAYRWLQMAMDLSDDRAHISMMDEAQCLDVMRYAGQMYRELVLARLQH